MKRRMSLQLGLLMTALMLVASLWGTSCAPKCTDLKTCTSDGNEAYKHNCPNGSCSFPCNGGNAEIVCEGGQCIAEANTSQRVTLDCKGGGCKFFANGNGTRTLNCPGNNCQMVCTGGATCELTGCTNGCKLACNGTGACSQTCKDPSCTTTKPY